jgi:hypothetical protein
VDAPVNVPARRGPGRPRKKKKHHASKATVCPHICKYLTSLM